MMKQQHFRFKQLMIPLALFMFLSLIYGKHLHKWLGESNANSAIRTLPKSTTINNASVSGLRNSSEQFDDSNAVPDNENSVANEGTDDAAALDFKNWPPTEMLDLVLAEAAVSSSIQSKQGIPRLVVAASNSDYADFADNFANSLLAQNVTNFVLVPLDMEAHAILYQAYPKHTLPTMPGLGNHPAGKANFGTEAFKLVTASRPTFLQAFLNKGYAVLYNDIDMVWQHNAWDVIDSRDVDNGENDGAFETMIWNDGREGNICTCMFYFKPTPNSIAMLTVWADEIATNNHREDQAAFRAVAKRLQLQSLGAINKTIVFNNDEEFPAALSYVWEKNLPDNEKVVIIHNNWIVGKQAKKNRFEKAGLWKPSGKIHLILPSDVERDNNSTL
jgi:Nucleotide-diphospho-sugar transferase